MVMCQGWGHCICIDAAAGVGNLIPLRSSEGRFEDTRAKKSFAVAEGDTEQTTS